MTRPSRRQVPSAAVSPFPNRLDCDEAAHGGYRTKRVILEICHEMQQAMETGEPYQARLDPPPADPRVAHDG